LGDSLLALPTLRMIRQVYPRARITILTNRPVDARAAPLVSTFEGTNLFDEIIRYPVGTRDIRELGKMRAEIAQRKVDLLINLNPFRGRLSALRDWLFFRWAGVKAIEGTPWNERTVAFTTDEHGRRHYEWEAARIARRVQALMTVDLQDDRLWDLELTAREHAQAAELLGTEFAGGFIAASIGTKMSAKDWTVAKWRALFQEVSARHPAAKLVLLGSRSEWRISDFCLKFWTGPKLNLCGASDPRVSAAVLSRARLFLGHDSGPMHLAATVGVPCLAVFSARNLPGQWFPRGRSNVVIYHQVPCYGCDLERCHAHQKLCIHSISVEEVAQAAERMLGAN